MGRLKAKVHANREGRTHIGSQPASQPASQPGKSGIGWPEHWNCLVGMTQCMCAHVCSSTTIERPQTFGGCSVTAAYHQSCHHSCICGGCAVSAAYVACFCQWDPQTCWRSVIIHASLLAAQSLQHRWRVHQYRQPCSQHGVFHVKRCSLCDDAFMFRSGSMDFVQEHG